MLQRASGIAQELDIADRVTTIVADATQSGLLNGSADIVFSLNSMHWSQNWRKWIVEAARILRPGGVVFFTCSLSMPRSKILRQEFEAEVQRYFTNVCFGGIVPLEIVGGKFKVSTRYYAIGRKGGTTAPSRSGKKNKKNKKR